MRLLQTVRRLWMVFALLRGLSHHCWGQPGWQPDKTRVLVASITSWPAVAGLDPFNGTRKDLDLVAQLKRCGVTTDHLLFLKDKLATGPGIRTALARMVQQSEPDETLIFYFQGHGGRELLYCYDYNQTIGARTALAMPDLVPLLSRWRGKRVLLIGDCCCSGSLATVVQRLSQKRPDLEVAAFGSATASNLSTGNWTYTEALIRVFAGDPLVDSDRSGQISFKEAQQFLHNQMKYKEDQLCSLALSANFVDSSSLAKASGPVPPQLEGPYQIGDLVEARDSEEDWYTAEILAGKVGRWKVHYSGWDSKWDEWVGPKDLRAHLKSQLKVGQPYEVLYEKKWYPALVTSTVDDYFYFVHYLHEAGEDDEWITAERARQPRGPHSVAEFLPLADAPPPAEGGWVAAQWHDSWYRAQVKGIDNNTYWVRYQDDSEGHLSGQEILPLWRGSPLKGGDTVLACCNVQGLMIPGRVVKTLGDRVLIRWEDGGQQSVLLERVAPVRKARGNPEPLIR